MISDENNHDLEELSAAERRAVKAVVAALGKLPASLYIRVSDGEMALYKRISSSSSYRVTTFVGIPTSRHAT